MKQAVKYIINFLRGGGGEEGEWRLLNFNTPFVTQLRLVYLSIFQQKHVPAI